MKKFVPAFDSFKGTMSSKEVADIVAASIRKLLPDAEVCSLPLADGGEGLVRACLSIMGGQPVSAQVQGPFGELMDAEYGLLPDGGAVIEMAACAGLPLVGDRRDPLHASTYGVGQLLQAAAERGAKYILLGLGGSATNDGGIGMAAALGWQFLDKNGNTLPPLAENLDKIAKVLPPQEPFPLPVRAACDVNNPLCGAQGATRIFGPQKGVTEELLPLLDDGLANLAKALLPLGKDVKDRPGAGAAGGLGAGAMAFLNAELTPGIELILDAARFDELLEGADLLFVGEGRMDGQSLRGKAPIGAAKRAQARGIPCIALCGSLGDEIEKVYEQGITAAFAAVTGECSMESIKKTCRGDMAALSEAVLRTLLI
ncbi:MAG: glycerate kinase [Clostridia bacterium]|nr:glycerate kinase [Clostridia bacterium]